MKTASANAFTLKMYLIAIAMTLCVAPVFAQSVTTMGTDFWVGFGRNSEGTTGTLVLEVRIVASNATKVTFHYTNSNKTQTYTLPAGGVQTVNLQSEESHIYNNQNGSAYKTLHITSEQPISVYAFNMRNTSSDATGIIPTSNLGKEYFHLGYRGNDASSNGNGQSSGTDMRDGFLVIATEDGTDINYDNGALKATLNKGQAYAYYAGSKNNNGYRGIDLTGKSLKANKNVAYFSVTENAQIPQFSNMPYIVSSGDNLYEQIPPVREWGLQFFVPVLQEQGVTFVRIVASQDNTNVEFSSTGTRCIGGGTQITSNSYRLQKAGDYMDLEVTNINHNYISSQAIGCYINASLPVGVVAYINSHDFRYNATALVISNTGDPAMTWIPPIGQTIKSTTISAFHTPSVVFDKQHAMIVTKDAVKNQTTMAIGTANPGPLSGGQWFGPVNAGYSFYLLPLNDAINSYYISNPEGMLVLGYGLQSAGSYYYTAGSALRNLKPSFYINDIHYQDLNGHSFCSNGSFKFEAIANMPLCNAMDKPLQWEIKGDNGYTFTKSSSDKEVFYVNNMPSGPNPITVTLKVYSDDCTIHSENTISTTFYIKANTATTNDVEYSGIPICNGVSQTIDLSTLVSAPGIANPKFTWYMTEGGAINLPSTIVTVSGNETYWVTVSGDNHCVSARKKITISKGGQGTRTGPPEGTIIWKEDFNLGVGVGRCDQDSTRKYMANKGYDIGYGSGTCIGDFAQGEYVIVQELKDVHTSWFQGAQLRDRTNPGNGHFFACDANSDPTRTKFINMTINGLCNGTKLYFSAWLVSLINGNPPHDDKASLKFSIYRDNTKSQLLTDCPYMTDTLPDAEGEWRNYGFEFEIKDPTLTSIYLEIENNSLKSYGNDFAMDDIEIRRLAPLPTTSSSLGEIAICPGDPFDLESYYCNNDTLGTLKGQWFYNSSPEPESDKWTDKVGNSFDIAQGVCYDGKLSLSGSNARPGYYRLAIAEPSNIENANCRSLSAIVEVKNKNCISPINDMAIVERDATLNNFDISDNDFISCTNPAFSIVGTPKHSTNYSVSSSGIVTYAPNNPPSWYGLDSFAYNVSCGSESANATAFVLTYAHISKRYIACPGKTVVVGFMNIPGVKYEWYDANNVLIAGPYQSDSTVKVTAGNANMTVYAEPIYNGMRFPRIAVTIETNTANCGQATNDCAVKGSVLFREDFGGNNISDTVISKIPLPPGRTDLEFKEYYHTHHGGYSLQKTSTYWADDWHINYSDHTHSNDITRGYVFMIDADDKPRKFYEHTITGLCEGSKLFFSTWVGNLMKKDAMNSTALDDPELRFELTDVNGKCLASFSTGEVPRDYKADGLKWRNYGFEFDVPVGEDEITLKIYNDHNGSNGNDPLLDDIEIRLCTEEVTTSVDGKSTLDTTACAGQTVTLLAAPYDDTKKMLFNSPLLGRWEVNYSAASLNNAQAWQSLGQTDQGTVAHKITPTPLPVTITKEAWYRYVIADLAHIGTNTYNCRAMSDIIHIYLLPFADANDIDVQAIHTCEAILIDDLDSLVSLKATSDITNPKYTWYDQNGSLMSSTKNITVSAPMTYWVTVSGDNYCASQNRKQVNITKADDCGTPSNGSCYNTGTLLWYENYESYGNPSDPHSKENLCKQITYAPCEKTTYVFADDDCAAYDTQLYPHCIWTEGTYMLTTGAPYWDGGSFMSDHTSGKGRMFLANGKTTVDKVYQQTIDDVCEDMELYFSFWVIGNDARLRWRIFSSSDNKLLATFYPTQLPSFGSDWKANGWSFYGFKFIAPKDGSIYFDIYNYATNASGNDFAVDDIEVRLCVPEVTTGAPDSVALCVGDSPYALTGSYPANTVLGTSVTAQWLFNNTDPNDPTKWSPVGQRLTNVSSVSNLSYATSTVGWYRLAVARQDGKEFTPQGYNCQAMSKIIRLDVNNCVDLYPAAGQSSATLNNGALNVTLCVANGGSSASTPPTYVTLYRNSISPSNMLATPAFSTSNTPINPGGTECLTMSVPNISSQPPFVAIIARINDDGAFPVASQPETNYNNNIDTIFNPAVQWLMKKEAQVKPYAPDKGLYANPVSVLGNEYITYTITARNASLFDGTVTIIDTLPAYMNYHAAVTTPAGASFSNSPVGSAPVRRELIWTIPNVQSQHDATVAFEATPESGSVASQPLFANHAWVEIDAPYDTLKVTTDSVYHQGAGVSLVTFSAGLGGWIFNASPQAVDYKSSARSGILVVPDSGYRFAGWGHDGYVSMRGAQIAPQEGVMLYDTLTVYGDVELRAVFAPEVSLISDYDKKIVAEPTEEKAWAYEDELHVRTLKSGCIIRIYAVDGVLHRQQVALSAGETTIKLPHGIYIVTINNGAGWKVRIEN